MKEWISSFFFIVSLYFVIVVVHILCPARVVEGYACDPIIHYNNDSKEKLPRPLIYCLNGLRCFGIIVGGFVLLHCYHSSQWQHDNDVTLYLARHYGSCAMASNVVGLLASYYFVCIRFPRALSKTQQHANQLRRAPTLAVVSADAISAVAKKEENETKPTEKKDGGEASNTIKDATISGTKDNDWDNRGYPFFFGKEFNPRWHLNGLNKWWPLGNDNCVATLTNKSNIQNGRPPSPEPTILDVKMVLYVIGAIVLELNVLSAVFYEPQVNGGSNSHALLLYAGLFTWFIVDYLWYEEVHLYTYDLFAEKIGFKLLW